MKPLNRVLKGRPIGLLQNVGPDLNNVVRPHSQEEPIEGRVVQSAQRDPILYDRLTLRLGVRDYMRGVEQFTVPQPAERTLISVCA